MIELKIDPEFRDLIPPLTEEEYQGLEKNLLENGFNPAFPILVWKGQNIIVDGHNRYSICLKHNLPFEYVEQEFASRYDVINEMFKIQFDRRNMSSRTKTYLVGRRYLIEKMDWGTNQHSTGRRCQNDISSKKTYDIIADQLGIGSRTVVRASEFTLAVDRIVEVTGIRVNDILNGKITDPMDDIKKLSEKDDVSIKRIIELIVANEMVMKIPLAIVEIEKEDREKQKKEQEERRKQIDKELREKREAEEAAEKERLRLEYEERAKQENERLLKEREEQEKRRLAEIERQKVLAEERAKNEAERERIRKQNEELEREELAKMEEHFKRLQELKQKKLDEQKQAEEERLKQVKVEKEKADKEKIEEEIKKVKVEIPVTPYDPYIESAKIIMGEIALNACQKKGTRYVDVATENYDDETTLSKNWAGKIWLDILGAKSDSKCYIEKLINGYLDGRITEAFVIARNDTGAEWFKAVSQKAKAVVFPLNGELKNHAIIYFGKNSDKFIVECAKYGWGIEFNPE